MDVAQVSFEWDPAKAEENADKHGVPFQVAQYAFRDPRRLIALDRKHSTRDENRYFCYGMVDGRVVTVRFTRRNHRIRIFGAGFWREGKELYYEKNRLF